MENISITKVLLLFYLLIGNSLLEPLLSKQWKTMVKENRLIQHVIAFTTMLTLVVLVSEGSVTTNYLNMFVYALLAYIWFIFSTKMDIHFNIIVIVLLLCCYLYENHLKSKNIQILNDKILSDEQKNKIKEKNNKNNQYVMFGMMAIIVGGMVMYSNKKEGQYGGGQYSLTKFLLY